MKLVMTSSRSLLTVLFTVFFLLALVQAGSDHAKSVDHDKASNHAKAVDHEKASDKASNHAKVADHDKASNRANDQWSKLKKLNFPSPSSLTVDHASHHLPSRINIPSWSTIYQSYPRDESISSCVQQCSSACSSCTSSHCTNGCCHDNILPRVARGSSVHEACRDACNKGGCQMAYCRAQHSSPSETTIGWKTGEEDEQKLLEKPTDVKIDDMLGLLDESGEERSQNGWNCA